MVVALSVRHLLAGKAKIKLADLASQFFIGMSIKTHPEARDWLLETCRSAGFAAKILQEADNEPTALRFVSDGLGVALIPEQICSLPHDGVIFLPFLPLLRQESTIAWRTDNPSKPLKDYIQIVRDLSQSR